jgi:tetratricopeptide (TPR) repeat protein
MMTHAALFFAMALPAAAASAPTPRAAPPAPRAPATFEELSRRADAARLDDRAGEAVRLYEQAVRLRPNWDEGWWYLATLNYDLDFYAAARDAFRRFVELKPDGGPSWAFLGFCEYRLKEYQLALQHIQRGLRSGAGSSPEMAKVVRYHLGVLLTRFGEFEKGWAHLESLAKSADDDAEVTEAIGINVLRLPLLPHEIAPDQRELVLLAGRAAYAQAAQRPESAILRYKELLARYDTVPHLHYAYGCFLLSGDANAAIEEFKRELKISPGNIEARLQLAYEYLKRGDCDQALPYAEEAVRMAPKLFTARYAYGRALLEKGGTAEAIQHLEAGVALEPGSPQLRYMLARAYSRAGRTEDAKRENEVFQQMDEIRATTESAESRVRLTPQDPEAHRALAEAYGKARREEEAKRELRFAQQLEQAAARPQPSPTPSPEVR